MTVGQLRDLGLALGWQEMSTEPGQCLLVLALHGRTSVVHAWAHGDDVRGRVVVRARQQMRDRPVDHYRVAQPAARRGWLAGDGLVAVLEGGCHE